LPSLANVLPDGLSLRFAVCRRWFLGDEPNMLACLPWRPARCYIGGAFSCLRIATTLREHASLCNHKLGCQSPLCRLLAWIRATDAAEARKEGLRTRGRAAPVLSRVLLPVCG